MKLLSRLLGKKPITEMQDYTPLGRENWWVTKALDKKSDAELRRIIDSHDPRINENMKWAAQSVLDARIKRGGRSRL